MIYILLRDGPERRIAAVLLALGAAEALRRAGALEGARACLWRRHPDVAALGRCKQVVPRAGEEGAAVIVKALEEYAGEAPGGVTVEAWGRVADAELIVEADAYTNPALPVEAGIADLPADVLIELRGHDAEGRGAESFAGLGRAAALFTAQLLAWTAEAVSGRPLAELIAQITIE